MTRTLKDHVAGEVRAELGRKRMTQSALAKRLGRSEAWVSLRLQGETPFDLVELEQVAQILDVPVTRFMPTEAVAS